MTSNSRDSKYKVFTEIGFREVKRVLRPYSDRYSKKTYTQHQHAVAVLLMKYERKTYRDIAELLKELWLYFAFDNEIPHFTTLQKFFDRVQIYVWDFLISKTYELFQAEIANVAIDSTGYKLDRSSYYYERRINLTFKKKRFMKHFISVDTDKQAVICSIGRKSHVNDNKLFRPIARKTRAITKIGNLTADKGFDSEENNRYGNEDLGANTIIPPRNHSYLQWRTKGRYRKKMRRNFPVELYHQREKVETVNFVEKSKFGEGLRSKLLRMQRKEMVVVDIVYNIYRYINHYLSLWKGFLHRPARQSFISLQTA
ncbi:MAG: IS5 family transposase [Candidatus Micrarchaeaceae archaeon]